MSIKTFVFLDSETTGLPHFEHNKTRITELCLISAQADHVSLGVIPRVQNKLNLCFNPMKNIHHDAAKITGLYNDDLHNESAFNEGSLELLIHFVERLSKPVCFVAHNGFNFDYPILRNHIENVGKTFPENIVCIDSLCAFREILNKPEIPELELTQPSNSNMVNNDKEIISDDWDDILYNEVLRIEQNICETSPESDSHKKQILNETTPPPKKKVIEVPGAPKPNRMRDKAGPSKPTVQRKLAFNDVKLKRVSFKLGDVYERVVQKEPINAHQAEADVRMLLECAVHLGETFVEWANENAVIFNKIPKMETGKKIGLLN